MPEKLKHWMRIDEEAGIRAGVLGLAFLMPGVALGFLGWPLLGYGVAAFGIALMFLGMLIHLFFHWRSILRLNPKVDVKNDERRTDES